MSPLVFVRPVLFAVFLWWFTTGLIIAAYGRSARFVRVGFWGATALLAAALWGIAVTRDANTPASVYLAFSCGLVVWGWQIAGYYLGFVTGPATPLAAAGVPAAIPQAVTARFRYALRASAHHELLAVAFALLLTALTWDQPNRWALWIYLILWLMHSSAKLNVFLGVRNFRIEFLPRHLHHLQGVLGRGNVNPLLPAAVTAGGVAALLLVYRGIAPYASPVESIGYLLLATMIGLGLLEHALLVIPVPVALWGWGLRPLPAAAVREERPLSDSEKLSVRAMSDQTV